MAQNVGQHVGLSTSITSVTHALCPGLVRAEVELFNEFEVCKGGMRSLGVYLQLFAILWRFQLLSTQSSFSLPHFVNWPLLPLSRQLGFKNTLDINDVSAASLSTINQGNRQIRFLFICMSSQSLHQDNLVSVQLRGPLQLPISF